MNEEMTLQMQQAALMYKREKVQNSSLRVVLYTATEETCKRDLQKSPTKIPLSA